MEPVCQSAADSRPESIDFVPKREVDRLLTENNRLRTEIERQCPGRKPGRRYDRQVFRPVLRVPRAVILDIVLGTGETAPFSIPCPNR